MSEPIEDINGFMNYHYFDARSMDALKRRLVEEIRVPARIIEVGLNKNGFPFAFVHISVKEKKSPKKTAPPSIETDSSILDEGLAQQNSEGTLQ